MNNTFRTILYVLLLLISTTLWNTWEADHQRQRAHAEVTETKQAVAAETTTVKPQRDSAIIRPQPATASTASLHTSQDRLVHVESDLLSLQIDPVGGNIVTASLKAYPKSLTDKTPVELIRSRSGDQLLAQSAVVTSQGAVDSQLYFRTSQQHYQLQDGQDSVTVNFKTVTDDGLRINKSYRLVRGKYDIETRYEVNNKSAAPWVGAFQTALLREKTSGDAASGRQRFGVYTGAAYYQPSKPYTKLSYKDMKKERLDRYIQGGWIAEQVRYFVTAWAPEDTYSYHVQSQTSHEGRYQLAQTSPQNRLLPGESAALNAKLYVGPEIEKSLTNVSPGLELTVDYGWLWWISDGLYWVMDHLYNLVGNWGAAIVLTTIMLKLLLYRLSSKSYQSMAKLRKLQPRIDLLKKRHGDEKEAMGQAMMALYKDEGVNPVGGCLPILVQIPFFIGLYYVLVESVQLRLAPLAGWIHDLSAADPYFVLPVLMGLSMALQQKLTPMAVDQVQAKMMAYGMPVFMTFIFLKFPSGLVLYWFTNNMLSVLQQWWIMRKFS